LLAAGAACERGADDGGAEGPRVIELTNDTIRLEAGVRVLDVRVQRAQGGEFEPASGAVRQGDVVRFTAHDNGGHAIAFDGSALAPDVLEYLERTGQLRSPPLIASGSAWIIKLDDAPAGSYPFRCATHDVAGSITVTAR
jgi:plastocyanin